jgi:hypothetical protein
MTDFKTVYIRESKKMGLTSAHQLQAPFLKGLASVESVLEIKCDRIAAVEWEPILKAIQSAEEVVKVRLYCGKNLFRYS